MVSEQSTASTGASRKGNLPYKSIRSVPCYRIIFGIIRKQHGGQGVGKGKKKEGRQRGLVFVIIQTFSGLISPGKSWAFPLSLSRISLGYLALLHCPRNLLTAPEKSEHEHGGRSR